MKQRKYKYPECKQCEAEIGLDAIGYYCEKKNGIIYILKKKEMKET